MEKSILEFETMADLDLQEIQGGLSPSLIPVAVGFCKRICIYRWSYFNNSSTLFR